MTTKINAFVMNATHPPVLLNAPPPAVPTATMVSASLPASRMRTQSWRGKYLRALNICPEEVEAAKRKVEAMNASKTKPRVRSMSFQRNDYDCSTLSRSFSSSTEKEDEERKSLERSVQDENQPHHLHHRIHVVPLRAPMGNSNAVNIRPGNSANPYGFAMRPELARGRRCHTDPYMVEDRLSAPIQIPMSSGMSNQLDGNLRLEQRRHVSPQRSGDGSNENTSATADVRLLSWEDPVAMQAAADAVAKGWHIPHHDAMAMELGVRREKEPCELIGGNMEDVEEEGEEDEDVDSHGGDIFEMDELHDGDSADERSGNQESTPVKSSRRRYRTASLNIVSSGREKRFHQFDDNGHGFSLGIQELSKSFVPPHQMVQRDDCFSIGLRDEFKRRPANPHI